MRSDTASNDLSPSSDCPLVLPFVQTAPQILHDRGLRGAAAVHACPCVPTGTLLAKACWQRGQPPAKRFPSRARAGPNAGPAAPPHAISHLQRGSGILRWMLVSDTGMYQHA